MSSQKGIGRRGEGGDGERGYEALGFARKGASVDYHNLWTSKKWRKLVDFYSSVFQDLISEGFLAPNSKALETLNGHDVFALKEIGVKDSIGISKKSLLPLVRSGQAFKQPFANDSFDFAFSGGGGIERSNRLVEFAVEVGWTLKPKGILVVDTGSAKDMYSFDSFIGSFNCCRFVRSRMIEGPDSSSIHKILLLVHSGTNYVIDVNKIQGFDFVDWLKNMVTTKDFVVMKMDVEGADFDLIPRLFETGTICLIDEIFLECHYNRRQKCCPSERSLKYEKTYEQ